MMISKDGLYGLIILGCFLVVGCIDNAKPNDRPYRTPDPTMGPRISADSYHQASVAAWNACYDNVWDSNNGTHPLLFCTCVSQSVVSNIQVVVEKYHLQYETEIVAHVQEMFLTQQQANDCLASASPRLVKP